MKRSFIILIFTMSVTLAFNQVSAQTDSSSAQSGNQDLIRRHSVGSSLLMLGNITPGDPDLLK